LAEIFLRTLAIKRCYIFPPHPINASALPCETENTENVSFHVNVSCRHKSHRSYHLITVRLLFIDKTIGYTCTEQSHDTQSSAFLI